MLAHTPERAKRRPLSRSSFDFGIAAFTVYRNRRPSRAREGLEPPGCGLHRSVLRIAEAVRGLSADQALIDGEAVVLATARRLTECLM